MIRPMPGVAWLGLQPSGSVQGSTLLEETFVGKLGGCHLMMSAAGDRPTQGTLCNTCHGPLKCLQIFCDLETASASCLKVTRLFAPELGPEPCHQECETSSRAPELSPCNNATPCDPKSLPKLQQSMRQSAAGSFSWPAIMTPSCSL